MGQTGEETPTQLRSSEMEAPTIEATAPDTPRASKRLITRRTVLMAPFSFLGGMTAGYLLWKQAPGLFAPLTGMQSPATGAEAKTVSTVIDASTTVRLPEKYPLPVILGDIGPRLIEAGAIDRERFVATYTQAGQPLSAAHLAILDQGAMQTTVIDQASAYFLLNLLWALGLANRNPILTEGAMATKNGGRIESYASTGGWTLATKPVTELYAGAPLIPLSPDQQSRVDEAAGAVYRPCCNNSTAFPDCNHGMAMLGLLELMAAQGAAVDAMLQAAKFVNAFWFPRQMAEIAILLKVTEGIDFADADARRIAGANYSSSSGFQGVHQWLADSGHVPQSASGGSQCGV